MSRLSQEPVRVYLGGVLAALVLLLVGYGILDETQGALWGGLGTALVGFPAVELTRSKVTPVPKPRRRNARVVDDGYTLLEVIGAGVVIGIVVLLVLEVAGRHG